MSSAPLAHEGTGYEVVEEEPPELLGRNLVWSLAFVKKPAEANPWASRSIEFQLPSPVPVHNFDRIPVFSGDPYGYGEGPAPSWVLPAGAPAGRE